MAIDRAQQNWPEEMTRSVDAENQLDGVDPWTIAVDDFRKDAQGEDEFEYLRRTR